MSKKDVKEIKKESAEPGMLFSGLIHPVEISYNGESMIVPARAKKHRIDDVKKLGALPSGVRLVKTK